MKKSMAIKYLSAMTLTAMMTTTLLLPLIQM